MSVGSKEPEATGTHRYPSGFGNTETVRVAPGEAGMIPTPGIVPVALEEGDAVVSLAFGGCGDGTGVAARFAQADRRTALTSKLAATFTYLLAMGRLS